jgi:hypothetical protein
MEMEDMNRAEPFAERQQRIAPKSTNVKSSSAAKKVLENIDLKRIIASYSPNSTPLAELDEKQKELYNMFKDIIYEKHGLQAALVFRRILLLIANSDSDFLDGRAYDIYQIKKNELEYYVENGERLSYKSYDGTTRNVLIGRDQFEPLAGKISKKLQVFFENNNIEVYTRSGGVGNKSAIVFRGKLPKKDKPSAYNKASKWVKKFNGKFIADTFVLVGGLESVDIKKKEKKQKEKMDRLNSVPSDVIEIVNGLSKKDFKMAVRNFLKNKNSSVSGVNEFYELPNNEAIAEFLYSVNWKDTNTPNELINYLRKL